MSELRKSDWFTYQLNPGLVPSGLGSVTTVPLGVKYQDAKTEIKQCGGCGARGRSGCRCEYCGGPI